MAKNRVPKKIAGFKLPKAIRKSPALKTLLGSETGRKILGDALIAGAAAASAALVQTHPDTLGNAGKDAVDSGKKAGNLAAQAVKDATGAMANVIGDAARALLPAAVIDAAPKKSRGAGRAAPATH